VLRDLYVSVEPDIPMAMSFAQTDLECHLIIMVHRMYFVSSESNGVGSKDNFGVMRQIRADFYSQECICTPSVG